MTDGEEGYVAFHPQLPGCISQGDTSEEAIENLADARVLYIETLLQDGLSVPQPMTVANAYWQIDLADFFGELEDQLQIVEENISDESDVPAIRVKTF
ncbi:MAG: type II toxin-antitoxin system HicB family antitoxin [Anaerolineae bacterium]|nr:type II toxin-antitoxin system HicB family antitoxin [Anaerolineae bacterium]